MNIVFKNLVRLAYENPKYRKELFFLLQKKTMLKRADSDVSKIKEDASKGVFSGYTLGVLSEYYSSKGSKFKNPNPSGGKDQIAMSTLVKYYTEAQENPEYNKFLGQTTSEIQRAFNQFYSEFERQQEQKQEEDEDESDDEVVDEDELRKTLKENGISEALAGLKEEQIKEIGSLVDEISDPEKLGVNTEEFYKLAERMMYEVGDDEVWLSCGLKDTPEGLAQMEAYLRDLGFDPKKVFNESGMNDMSFFEQNLGFTAKFSRPVANLIKKQTNSYERTIDLYGNKLFGGAMKMIKAVSGKDLGKFDPDNPDAVTQNEFMQYLSKKFSTKPVNMEEIMKSYHDELKSKFKDDDLFDKVYEQLKKANFSTVQTMMRKDRLEKLDKLKLDKEHKTALDEMIAKGAFKKARKYIEEKKIFSEDLEDFMGKQVALKDTIKKLTQEYYEKEDIGINPEMRRQLGKNTYALMGLVKKGFANEISEQSVDKIKDYIKTKVTSFNSNSIPVDQVQNHLTNLNEYNKEVLNYAKKGAKKATMASLGGIGGKLNDKSADLITNKIQSYLKNSLDKKGIDYLQEKFSPVLKEQLGFDEKQIKEFFSIEKGTIDHSMGMLRKALENKLDVFSKQHEDTILKFMGEQGNKIDEILNKSTELTEELKEQVKDLKPEQLKDFLKERSEEALKKALGTKIDFDGLQELQIKEMLKSNKKILFDLIPDKDELNNITKDLSSELSKELNPLYDKFKAVAVEKTEILKQDIMKEANTIADDVEEKVAEKTKELLDKNYEIADNLVKGDAGEYLNKLLGKTKDIMDDTENKTKMLNSIVVSMKDLASNENLSAEAKEKGLKSLNLVLANTKKELSENMSLLKLKDIPDSIKEKGFGDVDPQKLLEKYNPDISAYQKKILEQVLSAENHLKDVQDKISTIKGLADSIEIPKDLNDVNSLVKNGVGELNSQIETQVKSTLHKVRDEGIKMLSDKLDNIKPGESLDKFKSEAENLLKNKVETLKQELVNSKEYASDEIDKLIEDAELSKEKALKALNSKLEEGFDKVIEYKKDLLGGLQVTSDSIKRIHDSIDLKDPQAFLDNLKMHKVEMLNKAQSSATSFLKDKYQGFLENASIDTNEDPTGASALVSSGIGATLNMAGGMVMGLVSSMVMSKVMEKSFYKQIEDKHGQKEVLIQKILSGSMTPVKIDKEYRKEHDKIMKDTKMSPSKREQELFKLRLKYEDQARPAIARALYLMGQRDEEGEKIEGASEQMRAFLKRAFDEDFNSNEEFNYASFYIVASEEDAEIPFYMQIELDIAQTEYQKEMKKHTEDFFSGKKNKELFEYMTGKKPIPRKYYDQVKKEHIEKAHQISEDYKKKKNPKTK